MTRQQWDALRRGSIIRAVRSGTLRIVLRASPTAIHLPILRHAWRKPCPVTTYMWNDARRLFEATGRSVRHVPRIVCPIRGKHQIMHKRRWPK